MTQSGADVTTSFAPVESRSAEPNSAPTGVVPGRPTECPLGRAGSRIRRLLARLRPDAGMNTAEYAVGTLAAVAFAGLLLKVLTSGDVQAALTGVIERALR